MKRTFVILLFVFIMGLGSGIADTHAQAYYGPHLIAGPIGMITGGVFMFTADDTSFDDMQFTVGVILLGAGALDLILGLILWGIGEPAFSFSQAVEENPMLRLVSFNVTPSGTFIGGRFSF